MTFWVRTCGKLRRLILTRQGSSTPDSRLFGKLGFISACSAVPGFSIFWLISWGGGHLQHCVRRIQAQAQSTETLLIFYRGNLHKNWPVSCLARRTGQGGPPVTPGTRGTQKTSPCHTKRKHLKTEVNSTFFDECSTVTVRLLSGEKVLVVFLCSLSGCGQS